jgi:phage portal protein BeeE
MPPEAYQVAGVEVPAERMVIIRRSPQPGIVDGMGGVIRLARITFAAAIAAEAYASRYWQNGGSPTTVLESDGAIPDPLAKAIAERWSAMRRLGPDHPAVLGSGLKARDHGADPTQQAAVEARREQVADVGRYFGIPTRILNAPTGDSETYATSEMGNQDLVRYTLQNYIGAIEDAISEQLPGGRRMVMMTQRLTLGTQLATAQALQLLTGNKPVMTTEEAREYIGLAPIEDPSELMAPAAAPAGGPNG